jgi:hypothetical protein
MVWHIYKVTSKGQALPAVTVCVASSEAEAFQQHLDVQAGNSKVLLDLFSQHMKAEILHADVVLMQAPYGQHETLVIYHSNGDY